MSDEPADTLQLSKSLLNLGCPSLSKADVVDCLNDDCLGCASPYEHASNVNGGSEHQVAEMKSRNFIVEQISL